MNELLDKLFSTSEGRCVYNAALSVIDSYGMAKKLKEGTLVGLSGGADSVMLLLVLLEYRRRVSDFQILAIHVNHMIRGEEAERDEHFSEELCKSLGVEYESVRIDVPRLAQAQKTGLEEAARKARYSAFEKIISVREDIRTVAVAHNATDNLETVIFNMMRGTGLLGVCGISPVRDNVVRPLITSPKSDIVLALQSVGIEYVVDSTNLETEYSRNYIRHKIIPALSKLNASPESMATRLSENLRADEIFISKIANTFIMENRKDGAIDVNLLRQLDKAVFSRVLRLLTVDYTDKQPERAHIDAIYSLLPKDSFSFSLPGQIKFVLSSGKAFIEKDLREPRDNSYSIPLSVGVNSIPNSDEVIIITNSDELECYSNIYKISIQAQIRFDIIKDGLSARTRLDGDAYRFGGMTRKLKKLFNDCSLPRKRRDSLPVICDREGIVWVPGFRVRDGAYDKNGIAVALASPLDIRHLQKNRLQKGTETT